jgi:hypothetical protein
MNKFSIIKYIVIAAVIGGIYFTGKSDNSSYVEDEMDLKLVLDITVETLYAYQKELDATQGEPEADQAFLGFADSLAKNYNKAQPAIYTAGSIGVSPQTDASLLAFDDANANLNLDQGEKLLFRIEIDGENARIIASSRSGAVSDLGFSGSSLLTGYLIGSLLSRQSAAGVSSKNLANKKTVTSKQATANARSRAGSGSHSRGK